MTLERLRQDKGIKERLEQLLKEEIPPKALAETLNPLISDGKIIVPNSNKTQRAALEDLFDNAQNSPEKLIFLEIDSIFPGGYQGNKPSKQPYYNIFTHANLEKGVLFHRAFKNTEARVKFPNSRMGYSWPPEIPQTNADKRKRVITELHLDVGTILSADEKYTSQILINGYNPHKKLRAKYRQGMNAVVTLPSVSSPGKTHTVTLLQMPIFLKKQVGAHLTEEQALQTYNFYPDDDSLYKIPSQMSFFRQPVTPKAAANVQGELLIGSYGKASIDACIDWIRDTQRDFQVPDLLPDAQPEMIKMFWYLTEKVFTIPKEGNPINAQPLKDWAKNKILLNYRGWLNEQKK
jgi:hypothetical protein